MPLAVIAAVLFSAMLHAGWNALLRNSVDRQWTASWIGISTFLVCAPLIPFVGLPRLSWPFVLCSAVLHVLYLTLLAQVYKLNELSFAYPIARGTSPMLVAVGGFVTASEKPGLVQALGIVAIVAGIIGIGLESKKWDRLGLLVALAIGVVIALYTVVDGIGARRSGLPMQYNVWCFSTYGFAILVIQIAQRGRRILECSRSDFAMAFCGGMTSVIAYAIVTWAMVHSPMGSVSALRETSTLFAAGIGMIFLKERFSMQRALGCVAIVAGAVVIGMAYEPQVPAAPVVDVSVASQLPPGLR